MYIYTYIYIHDKYRNRKKCTFCGSSIRSSHPWKSLTLLFKQSVQYDFRRNPLHDMWTIWPQCV